MLEKALAFLSLYSRCCFSAAARLAPTRHSRAPAKHRYGDSAHYQYGEIQAQLGAVDEALGELRLALAARDPGMAFIRVDPFLDPLRRDPRFAAIEAKLNFS